MGCLRSRRREGSRANLQIRQPGRIKGWEGRYSMMQSYQPAKIKGVAEFGSEEAML